MRSALRSKKKVAATVQSSEWTEAERGRRSVRYQHNSTPRKYAVQATLVPLHYESDPGSGSYDTAVDFTPVRVRNARFDGWEITAADYHYSVGRPPGQEDGWVGFGARQGAHWLRFRLERVAWLYWTERELTLIEGAANYDRANLSQAQSTLPTAYGESYTVGNRVTWANVFPHTSIRWKLRGDRLKEEVLVTQAGRDALPGTYPATPLDETYLTLLFRLDVSDVPRIYRDAILQDWNGDFADDDAPLEARDALDRLLFLLPLDSAYIYDEDENIVWEQRLRKRVFTQDGVTWLAVGLRADHLNGAPDGTLILDPTVDVDVGASGDDGYAAGVALFSNNGANDRVGFIAGNNIRTFWRFDGVTCSGTIDTALLDVKAGGDYSGAFDLTLSCVDADDPSAPGDATATQALTPTTATVAWDSGADWENQVFWSAQSGGDNRPEIKTCVQELVDSYTISSDAVIVLADNNGETGSRNVRAYDNDAADAANLYLEYTESGGSGSPWNAYAQQ